MNSIESIIYPPIKKTLTANKISIEVIDMKLFVSIRIFVRLLDTDDNLMDARSYTIDGTDYSNWNTPPYNGDDKYILDWVKRKLNDESNNN